MYEGPNPKNPIIANFFRNIGRADRLGSGVRNLFKYSKFYSGQNPEFQEGDVFRVIVPLDEEYSFDHESSNKTTGKTTANLPLKLTKSEEALIKILRENPSMTQPELAKQIGLSVDGIRSVIKRLKSKGMLSRKGSKRSGSWQIHI